MLRRTLNRLRRPLAIEPLEARHMLTTGLSAILDGSTLKITGTSGNDAIFLIQSNGRLGLMGSNQTFAAAQVSQIVIDGQAGNDQIQVNSQLFGYQPILNPTIIYGGAGHDFIVGGEGVDVIFGGEGDDIIHGGSSSDYLDGGLGNDVIFGGAGDDTINGDTGNDTLLGEDGNDILSGGDGRDVLYGGLGSNWLDGGRAYDWLLGTQGINTLFDDQASAVDNYFASGGVNSRVNGHFAWFDMNVQDDNLRGMARYLYRDGVFGRTDLMALFSQVAATGSVDTAELSDLRLIVSNASLFNMSDYVSNLASKVVNSNTANAAYQGAALGNLAVGSSGLQLTQLVNKWFLGTDRPDSNWGGTTYAYQYASGSLFTGGIQYTDIRQGLIGNCYFLVGLVETAIKTPSVIQNMFIDNGDGTYTVRFYNNGKADYVTIDRYLPTDRYGRLVFASMGTQVTNSSGELWVALAEKAYAQMNASGWMRTVAGNSYGALSAGYEADAFRYLTGRSASVANAIDFSGIASAFLSGALVGVTSKFSGVASGILPGHAYAVIGYDAASQRLTLFNPWGSNSSGASSTLIVSAAELQANFYYYDRTTS